MAANEGICSYCGGKFGEVAMSRHVNSCSQRNGHKESGCGAGKVEYVQLVVQGGGSTYWMFLDIDSNVTLEELDRFLRNVWLECCGHLSQFEINGSTFASYQDKTMGDRSMKVKLNKVLTSSGMKFTHEYDYGSTTTLQGKVVSIRKGSERNGDRSSIDMLARNVEPVFTCSYCSKSAEHTCVECVYDDEGFLCGSCAETHKCGEEMLLPITNSPRSGVCGYCG